MKIVDAIENSLAKIYPPTNMAITAASMQNPSEATTTNPTVEKWPECPGHCVFRLIVPILKMGSIIGCKGKLIKKMCKKPMPTFVSLMVLITRKEEPDAIFSLTMDTAIRGFKRVSELPDNDGDARAVGATFYSIRLLSFWNIMHNNEDVPSASLTFATLGTFGAPLFEGFKRDQKGRINRKSFFKSYNYFIVKEWFMKKRRLPHVSCSLPLFSVSLTRKVGAELIDTLILFFARTTTTIVNQKTQGSKTFIGLVAFTGLTVMIVILSTGHLLKAYLNVAVTIAFPTLKHFPWKHVPRYIRAPVMASLYAAFELKAIFHPIMGKRVTIPLGGFGQAFALEFIINFNLMFVVTIVTTNTRAVNALFHLLFSIVKSTNQRE
ncbi:aquaporin NIP6-1-like [Durio zibethinus]|uniref:Aquaporin NIP6-1-like n=1 Tax=Durio zibethinus TaxID=66656 RepID=A0A6P5YND0_DURZI|nr:aquaporin NIP6-1-like [Durio zibethinus]